MRIGVDTCCWSNRRGFGRFTRELLGAVVAADADNEYVFFADSETARQSEFPAGVQIVSVPLRVAPTRAASAAGRRSLPDVWALTRAVSRHDLDLFFFPAVYSYFPILNRTRIIVTIHDMIADHHPTAVFPDLKSKLFWKLKQRLALRQSDLILTVSHYSKQQIKRYFHLPERRIRAISEGPSHIFKPLPRDQEMTRILHRHGLDDSSRFVLYVGGISPHKNLGALIQAISELRDDALGDVKLVLVGDYQNDAFHSDYPRLKRQVQQLGLQNRVLFTGFVPDEELLYLYNAATVFALPSLEEGFGLPVVEAMSCGAPIVASNCGSLPEIAGEAGQFFNPRKVESIVAVLRETLGDDDVLRQMKTQSLERAARFTWEAVARQTIAIFADVAKRDVANRDVAKRDVANGKAKR